MDGSCAWLPPLVELENFRGDWNAYLDALYSVFTNDFIAYRPRFDGLPVQRRRYPLVRNKEATFWHIIAEGPIEEERTPDLRRCERIRWPKPVIEQARRQGQKIWKNKRGTQTCICIWIEDTDYLVVLADRDDYVLLLTAYCVTQAHTKRKLEKEYRAYKASAAP
jgi:hypothetical protein